jgi:hypothetical protein
LIKGISMDPTTAARNFNHSDNFARRRMLETEQKRWPQAEKEADHGGSITGESDPRPSVTTAVG